MPPIVACSLCDRVFTKKCSLNRHLSRVHDIAAKRPRKAIVCPVENCEETFCYHAPLRSHLSSVHCVCLKDEQRTFSSMKDFFEWKKKEEKQYLVKYVKACGVQQLLDGTEVFRFNCHRTGKYTPEGKGLRRLKLEGSCKIGASCPSTVTAHLHPNGNVQCFYCMTHVGHECGCLNADLPSDLLTIRDVENFHSTTADRSMHEPKDLPVVRVICSQKIFASNKNKIEIPSNVSISYDKSITEGIMLQVDPMAPRDSVIGMDSVSEMFDKIWKISNRDVYEEFQDHLRHFGDSNIFACLRNGEIYSEMMDLSDQLSWSQEENCLSLHSSKRASDTCKVEQGSEEELISNFRLFVLNSWQIEALKRLANGGLLCIDTVYGGGLQSNVIVTVFVWENERRSWLLCALYFCSSIDCENLEFCFTKIKNKTGILSPKAILYEDNDRLHSSWEKVMGKCDHWFLCPWHIDRTIRNKLKNITIDLAALAYIYEAVLTLIDCHCEKKFNETFYVLMKDLAATESLQPFLDFLNEVFVLKKALWINFDKLDADKGALKRLEANHYLVQHISHESQKTSSQALFALFLFFRSGHLKYWGFDEIMQQSLISEIIMEHEASVSLNVNVMCPVNSQCLWVIKTGDAEYTVAQVQDPCPEDCTVKCSACNICLHSFSCSCLGNSVQWNLCRHIHLVGRFLKNCDQYLDHGTDYRRVSTEEAVATILDDGSAKKSASIDVDEVCDSERVKKRDKILAEIEAYANQIIANSDLIVDENRLLQIKSSLEGTLRLSDSLPLTEICTKLCIEEEKDFQHEQYLNNLCATLDHDYA